MPADSTVRELFCVFRISIVKMDRRTFFAITGLFSKLLRLPAHTRRIRTVGCQKEIATQIREQKGHYVLALRI